MALYKRFRDGRTQRQIPATGEWVDCPADEPERLAEGRPLLYLPADQALETDGWFYRWPWFNDERLELKISVEDAGERGLPLVDLIHGRCPEPSCNGFITQYFGGASVYRITICTEATARQTATVKAEPVSAWEIPRQLTRVRAEDEDEDDE